MAGGEWRALHFGILSSVLRRPAVCCALLLGCLLISCLTGCGRQPAEKSVSQQSAEKAGSLFQDKPLSAYQTELLDLAFETATMIPIVPHIKDRSKTQDAVVTLCFKLDQPQRALRYIEKIGNWRRGSGYADYAFYCAQHGFSNEVQHYLDFAEQIATIADQDWGRDQIKIKISRTHTLLGQTVQAKRIAAGVDTFSESGKVARVEATLCTEDTFVSQVEEMDRLIATGDFDAVKNALYVCAELFNRFYDNTERRSQMEEKIKTSWKQMPVFIRIDLLLELADFALGHADQPKALSLVNEAKTIMDEHTWPAEYRIPLEARIAECRFRSGDEEAARSAAADLLTFYNQHQSEIINIDKAKTLIPVAEAFQTIRNSTKALAVYKPAVEAAVENPNSRPRAEDLSAICLSMVKHTVEPDAALWARIREIKGALGDPW